VNPGLNSGYQLAPNGIDLSSQLDAVRAADGLLYDPLTGLQVRIAANYATPRAEPKPQGRDFAASLLAGGKALRDLSGRLYDSRSGMQFQLDASLEWIWTPGGVGCR
jgi:hypothetical protein